MGNCLCHTHNSSTRWGEEDWGILNDDKIDGDDGFFASKAKGMNIMNIEEKGLLENHQNFDLGTSSSSASHEVKVKITKKQLEELLGRVAVKELSVQQVLAQLIDVSNQYEAHQGSWKPALQSIPELN